MSVLRSTCIAFSMRFAPSSPSSSRPGVSIITTGPSGSSSIALLTGSVVVPLMSDTMASFWPVSALMRLDLPAFLRPKMPMCVRLPEGVAFMVILLTPLCVPVIAAVGHDLIARPFHALFQGIQALGGLVPRGDLVII